MSNMQIPSNSVWSSMNYTPPRGSCNHKNGMISNKCPCLRFMLHPVKVGHISFCSWSSLWPGGPLLFLCAYQHTSNRPLPHSSATAAATMLPTTTWTIRLKMPYWQNGLLKKGLHRHSSNSKLPHHETNASALPLKLTMMLNLQ